MPAPRKPCSLTLLLTEAMPSSQDSFSSRSHALARGRLALSAFSTLSLIGRRWPLLRGADWLTRRRWVRHLGTYAGPMLRVSLRSGLIIEVDARDYDGLMVGLFGAAELQVIHLCTRLLCPGDVFVDIGANYGAVGLNCLDKVGPNGAVHLVEPQDTLAQAIESAISEVPNAYLHKVALSNEETEALLVRDRGHSGSASLMPGRTAGEAEVVSVKESGSFLAEIVGSRPCGVKVDVEGFEAVILPGILNLPGLRFVLFEHNRGPGRDIFSMIQESGMAVFALSPSWIRPRPVLIDNPRDMESFSDFLAVNRPLNYHILRT